MLTPNAALIASSFSRPLPNDLMNVWNAGSPYVAIRCSTRSDAW